MLLAVLTAAHFVPAAPARARDRGPGHSGLRACHSSRPMRMRLALPLCAAALAVPSVAAAQTPPSPSDDPPTRPGAGRRRGRVRRQGRRGHQEGALLTRRARSWPCRGRVKPYVAGQVVSLRVIRKGKQSKKIRRKVGAGGVFAFKVQVGNPGTLRFVVRHAATPSRWPSGRRTARSRSCPGAPARGSKGTHVLLLQRQLFSLGFATPVTGYFDSATARAVTAFRKTNGLGTTGYADGTVYGKLLRGQGAYRLVHPTAGKNGKHVEFDWSRQVLVLAQRATSTACTTRHRASPPRPRSSAAFQFYLKTPGTNSHGMVDSSYFIGGYAIHGYADVPNYAASHGCIRVPIPNARRSTTGSTSATRSSSTGKGRCSARSASGCAPP